MRGVLPSSCRMQDSLARLLSERALKVFAKVSCEVIPGNWLTAILVNPL
jgi:hypothetical protein